MLRAKQGNYWYHFHNVFDMTRSLTRDWTRDLPHSKPACEVLYDHSSWLLWFNHIEKPFFPARLLWSNDYMNLAGNELPIATALTNSHRGNALEQIFVKAPKINHLINLFFPLNISSLTFWVDSTFMISYNSIKFYKLHVSRNHVDEP